MRTQARNSAPAFASTRCRNAVASPALALAIQRASSSVMAIRMHAPRFWLAAEDAGEGSRDFARRLSKCGISPGHIPGRLTCAVGPVLDWTDWREKLPRMKHIDRRIC